MQTIPENYYRWRTVFLICLGVFAGTAFCMKWMERDLLYNGDLFTVIGLEISYPKEKVAAIFAGIDDPVKNILRYHLSFDFAFMCGVYPGICALCMMAGLKQRHPLLRRVLLFLAMLQAAAFACDIMENCLLLKWMRSPGQISQFEWYHGIVLFKWVVAVTAALLAIPLAARGQKVRQQVV